MPSTRHVPIRLGISMQRNEKSTVYIEHRGHTLEISFLPDPAATPDVGVNAEYPLTQEQCDAWRRSDWWFFQLVIKVYDRDRRIADDSKAIWKARIPSFVDQHGLMEQLANELCDLEEDDRISEQPEETGKVPELRDHVFTLDEGMVIAGGKSHHPDLVRFRIPKEQGLSVAMQILRCLENSQFRPDEAYLMELPLFGRLERLKDE
ncbi:hypothetical protein PZT57_30780 [Pseudomonas aeruginosa]|uniref:hypothetical protein n=1 Tax=Pseudomonas aeruginosa TaxID=287 RepID=UPI002B268E99|nr:hypothetical protein [Pseudomonas aeruginosa]MEA8593035.1 hypothetical protein [Pseudomonas aeruginosa]